MHCQDQNEYFVNEQGEYDSKCNLQSWKTEKYAGNSTCCFDSRLKNSSDCMLLKLDELTSKTHLVLNLHISDGSVNSHSRKIHTRRQFSAFHRIK